MAYKSGLKPDEYVSAKPKDVFLMIEAYNEKVIDLHYIARLQTYILASPNLKKGYTFKQFKKEFWRLGEEDDQLVSDSLLETARKLYNGNTGAGNKGRG